MAITVQCFSTLLALLVFSCLRHSCHGAGTSTCREGERKALLQFKDSLHDHGGLLSSWVGLDCCSWWGVVCSNRTGHVIHLSLASPDYWQIINADEIHPSLLALGELQHLDLSGCNFSGAQIPKFFGSFEKLWYLDLSYAHITGTVPQELGNLSSLRYLNLAYSGGTDWDDDRLEIEDGTWLSNISSLQYLDLSRVEIKNPPDLQSLSMLPFLLELRLAGSFRASVPHALRSLANFTSLLVLDLSQNMLNATLPSWLFEIGSLRHLDLSYNDVSGHAPKRMTNLTSLQFLDLSNNERLNVDSLSWALSKLTQLKTLRLSNSNLKGQLPVWLGNLKSLEMLDLSDNQLDGKLSEGLGRLSSRLLELYLSGNSFDGVLTEEHFSNLPNLSKIDMSGNHLTIDIAPEWKNPPPITELWLDNCKVGPAFPAWLQKLENVSLLSLSNVSISDAVPDWLWNCSSNISKIILSNNMLKGRLPTSFDHLNKLAWLDLSNNQLEGHFPQFAPQLGRLDLSYNSISGRIPPSVGGIFSAVYIDVSANQLIGSIPSSICKLKELEILSLSHNRLSGEIPNCWGSHNMLVDIDLCHNDLHGTIPASIFSGSSLHTLDLESNNLSGGIPLTLQSSTALKFLNLGSNKFNGSIPTWLGGIFSSLEILSLRSNMFVGNIPKELGNLFSLRVIDLSQNTLSGSIPQTFANFSAMKHDSHSEEQTFLGMVHINMKGRADEYSTRLLSLPTTIDLSSNNLFGGIHEALMTLDGLRNLNLSRNHLTGTIPWTIMRLKNLESLDLSLNNLTGEIPSSMSNLNFLSIMNFSFNHLSGRIPKGGQFDNHPDPSIYLGNDHLCGFPLDSVCEGNATTNMPSHSNNKGEDEDVWFYVSIAAGFIIGIWTFIGALLLNRNWRIAYYQTIDNLYVFVKLNLVEIRSI